MRIIELRRSVMGVAKAMLGGELVQLTIAIEAMSGRAIAEACSDDGTAC
jgi:hypothetical protein